MLRSPADCQEVSRDHPNLVRRLVLHASAYTLGDAAKEIQMRVGQLARQRNQQEARTAPRT
jgi:hypothetical protein